MKTDTMAVFGLFVALTEVTGRKPATVVPEPEFERFKFPARERAVTRASALAAANDPALAELAA